ncbi:MAG: condensation domain-containing protein, partial [Betaproteobacteria bacterium]
PDPDLSADQSTYRAPVSEHEVLLCELFAEVTGASRVGLDDSFFAIGGDSISAMRLIGKVRHAGLSLSIRDLFEYPTAAALVKYLSTIAEDQSVEQALWSPEGNVPALPVYRQFLELGDGLDRFNQAMRLEAPAGMTYESAREILSRLRAHHAALRLRICRTSPAVFLIDPVEQLAPLELKVLDVANLSADMQSVAIDQTFEALSNDLRPDRPGAMQVCCWVSRGADVAPLLLWVIHHFAVDGVSWRILLQDLRLLTRAQQSLQGSYAQRTTQSLLPAPTMSLRQWASMLEEIGKDGGRRIEEPLWLAQLERAPALPRDLQIAAEDNTNEHAVELHLALNEAQTRTLLKSPAAYHAQINDVLLAALGVALCQWSLRFYQSELDCPLITLEGHGRELDTDLSQTVGWFTSVFPLRLPIALSAHSHAVDWTHLIKAVKEQLRAIPDKGLGYGILRYLDPASSLYGAQLSVPDLSFNYLGRLEQSGQDQAGWSQYRSGLASAGDTHTRQRICLLEINALIDEQGILQLFLTYNHRAYREDAMHGLLQGFKDALIEMAVHCVETPSANRFSPSDFALVQTALRAAEQPSLTQDTLDDIVERYPDIQNLWPLTPLQQGMAFESFALASGESDPYHVSLSARFTSPLPAHQVEQRLSQAWMKLLTRHPALRICLTPDGLCSGTAIVRSVERYALRVVELKGDAVMRLEALKSLDMQEPFDLTQGPLIRLYLCALGTDAYALHISNHHLLIDGWSMSIMLNELLKLYELERVETSGRVPIRQDLEW